MSEPLYFKQLEIGPKYAMPPPAKSGAASLQVAPPFRLYSTTPPS